MRAGNRDTTSPYASVRHRFVHCRSPRKWAAAAVVTADWEQTAWSIDMTQQGMEELEFEWDEGKATENLNKHGIAFHEAKEVFGDPHPTDAPAKLGKGGEIRRRRTGRIKGAEPTITVIYTMRNNGRATRIISARPASEEERTEYDDNKMQVG
jgi:uncharacterized protein